MSNALEQLVRPFQSPDAIATRRIVRSQTTITPDPVVVTWGEAGDMPVAVEVPAGEDPQEIGFEVKKRARHDLVARETEKFKITNPDDPNQYVIAERLKKATFKEKNVDAVAAFPKGSTATSTQTTPGASPPGTWQPGETQVNTDGTGPLQQGEERRTYPLTIETRDYYISWPPAPNETPI